jgi:hypothetical protein
MVKRLFEPGEPEKRARAGTTVFGGMIVLSAILAQSFIMVNLPFQASQTPGSEREMANADLQLRSFSRFQRSSR